MSLPRSRTLPPIGRPVMLGVLGLQLISVAAAVATQQGPVAATPAAALVAPVAATAEWLCRTSEHGAQPGEERPATAALQAVIDTCTSRQVGQPCGRVVVDTPGTYLSGALLAADGCVHLELPAGATLLASARVSACLLWCVGSCGAG